MILCFYYCNLCLILGVYFYNDNIIKLMKIMEYSYFFLYCINVFIIINLIFKMKFYEFLEDCSNSLRKLFFYFFN